MKLAGKKVAVLVGPGYEDLEFWVPLMRLQEEGALVTVVGVEAGDRYASKSGGLTARAEVGADQVSAGQFDAVVVPGGWAPDKLRRYESVTGLVRAVYQANKIVASICHGGLVLISAGIVRGHRATGSKGIKDDPFCEQGHRYPIGKACDPGDYGKNPKRTESYPGCCAIPYFL